MLPQLFEMPGRSLGPAGSAGHVFVRGARKEVMLDAPPQHLGPRRLAGEKPARKRLLHHMHVPEGRSLMNFFHQVLGRQSGKIAQVEDQIVLLENRQDTPDRAWRQVRAVRQLGNGSAKWNILQDGARRGGAFAFERKRHRSPWTSVIRSTPRSTDNRGAPRGGTC